MLQPEEITEEQWRAAMSTYHKMIRKEPVMAWQAVCAAVINLFVEAQQMESCPHCRSHPRHDAKGGRMTETEKRCHAARDGDCAWEECPQNRDGEPAKSGRHCPYDHWCFYCGEDEKEGHTC